MSIITVTSTRQYLVKNFLIDQQDRLRFEHLNASLKELPTMNKKKEA